METQAEYKTRAKNGSRKIVTYIIKGEKEFAEAFGFKDPEIQARLRSEGMPCLFYRGVYFYNPVKVLEWMEENWKVPTVKQL